MIDVVIVGAGPAGTAAACDLLESGLTVHLLDKYEFPRKKACAGGITPKGYRLFKYDVSSMVKRQCSRVCIQPPGRKSFVVSGKKTLCYMTDRRELDLFSLNRVIQKGARFSIVRRILSIEETPSHVSVETDSGTFQCRFLIGADGANSRVRQIITKKKLFKKLMAVEADIQIPRPDQHDMEFDFSRFNNGYFWIFPKQDHLNVGIYSGRANTKLKVESLKQFVAERFGNVRLDAVKGYPICTGGVQYVPDKERIFLAGDAAGLAEPLFGEGIYFALKSGQAAAHAIIQGCGESRSARLRYARALKMIQWDLKLYHWSAAVFYRFPWLSFKLASLPVVQKRFARVYGGGKTLLSVVYDKDPVI